MSVARKMLNSWVFVLALTHGIGPKPKLRGKLARRQLDAYQKFRGSCGRFYGDLPRMGNCRFPLYIRPTMAREWSGNRILISQRRVRNRQLSFPSPCMSTGDVHPSLPISCASVGRNLDRARRRYLRARGNVTDNGDVTPEGGSDLPEPPGDEPIPAEPDALPLTLPPPSHELQGSDDPRYAEQSVSTMPNIPTSKRPGGPLDPSPRKEARASQELAEAAMEVYPEDSGLPSWGDGQLRFDANQEDQEHALTPPLLGWPNFARLFGDNIVAPLAHDTLNLRPLRNPGPTTAHERQPGRDPVIIALAEAGASHADPRIFWMRSGGGQPENPILNSHFKVFKLPGRQVPKRKNVSLQRGIPLGSNASDENTNSLRDPKCAPPALRKSSPREVLGFLRARCQLGFPASMQTDA